MDKLDRYLEEAGRSRRDIGIEARISYGESDPDTWAEQLAAWEAAGATHISVNTMGLGSDSAADHLTGRAQLCRGNQELNLRSTQKEKETNRCRFIQKTPPFPPN